MKPPHLDHALQFWVLVHRWDGLELEKVQRLETKLIRGLEDLRYEETFKGVVRKFKKLVLQCEM